MTKQKIIKVHLSDNSLDKLRAMSKSISPSANFLNQFIVNTVFAFFLNQQNDVKPIKSSSIQSLHTFCTNKTMSNISFDCRVFSVTLDYWSSNLQ